MNTKSLALKRLGIDPHSNPVPTAPEKGIKLRVIKQGPKLNKYQAGSNQNAREVLGMEYVCCLDCDYWAGKCEVGFEPSHPDQPVRLCGRYSASS